MRQHGSALDPRMYIPAPVLWSDCGECLFLLVKVEAHATMFVSRPALTKRLGLPFSHSIATIRNKDLLGLSIKGFGEKQQASTP
jgi:hypothetical protein